jgi:Cu-Zn family superoxide dismutase
MLLRWVPVLGLLSACATGPLAPKPAAMATLAPTQGQTVNGDVSFRVMGDHIEAHVRLVGLPPNGEHGFHVHEKGDCNSADGMSAGGHFNPLSLPHGPQQGPHHAGDMSNLKADASGSVDARLMLHGVTLGSGATNLIGRSLIVHAKPDDYTTQPTGNSGARLACGVIIARS